MNREEARIYWIGRYEAARKWDDPHWEASERKEHRRYVDALNAAIKALSSAELPKGDYISRADAICEVLVNDGIDNIVNRIKALPSDDAEFADLPSYAEFADLPDIPRYYYEKVVGKMAHEINMLKGQLESAEAVQGEWVGLAECSVCGKQADDFIDGYVDGIEYLPNYCPNCGARMKGGAE